MKESARYVKIVEWSDEDHCYVGSCPGLRQQDYEPRVDLGQPEVPLPASITIKKCRISRCSASSPSGANTPPDQQRQNWPLP
jgi:hypothetical protein